MVAGAEFAFERVGLVPDDVEHALAAFDKFRLACLFFGGVVDEEFGEGFCDVLLRGDHGAVFRVGGAGGSACVKDKGREAGLVAEVFGHELVQRDGVFSPSSFVWAGGEDAAFCGVAAADARMGASGDDRHVLPEVLVGFEVGGGLVSCAFAFGHPVGSIEAEGEARADEAFGLGGIGLGCGEGRSHSVQEGQGHRDASCPEHGATVEVFACGDCWKFHSYRGLAGLLGFEGFACEGCVEDWAEFIIVFLGEGGNFLEVGTVAIAGRGTSGVGEEVFGEGLGEEFLAGAVDAFPLEDVGEFLPFGRVSGRVDFGGIFSSTVFSAPKADGIVIFKGQAGGVDFLVAGVAGFGVAVFVQLVADAGSPPDVGLDCRDIRRWCGDIHAKDPFGYPDPTDDGRGGGAVCGDFEDGAVGDETSAACVSESYLLEPFARLDIEAAEAVESGKAFIEHAEVGGNQVFYGEVILEDFPEEAPCLGEHGFLDDGVEGLVEV